MKRQFNQHAEGNAETYFPAPEKSRAAVFQLKKILVPVDFSACSRKALQYAVPFARQFGSQLVLLHVVEPFVAVPTPEMLPEDNIQVSTAEAEQKLTELGETLGHDVLLTTLVRKGSPHVEIMDTAKELEIDLVILSTHGRTGLDHVLLGSTAEKVVRRLGCPVLVVREHEHEFIHVSNSVA